MDKYFEQKIVREENTVARPLRRGTVRREERVGHVSRCVRRQLEERLVRQVDEPRGEPRVARAACRAPRHPAGTQVPIFHSTRFISAHMDVCA